MVPHMQALRLNALTNYELVGRTRTEEGTVNDNLQRYTRDLSGLR